MIFKSIRKIPQIYNNISVKVEECRKKLEGEERIRGAKGDRRGTVEDAFAMLGLRVPPSHPGFLPRQRRTISRIHSHADVHDTMETTGT